jgi:hypothetical protein
MNFGQTSQYAFVRDFGAYRTLRLRRYGSGPGAAVVPNNSQSRVAAMFVSPALQCGEDGVV